jgi:hypothetical protein
VVPESEFRLQTPLQHEKSTFLQPGGLDLHATHTTERWTTPQGKRLSLTRHSGLEPAGLVEQTRLTRQAFEDIDVDIVWAGAEGIAIWARLDDVAQFAPQHRHRREDLATSRGRRGAAPHGVDEAADRHHLVEVEGEHREYRALSWPGYRDASSPSRTSTGPSRRYSIAHPPS